MADPLTVVGVIANIVQLVDFSTKVLVRLNDFHSSVGEIPKAFRHIRAELPVLQQALLQTKDKIDNRDFEDSMKVALLPAIEGCRNQVEALDDLLAETLPAVGDSRFKKTSKALSSITQDGKVGSIMKTLRGYIATLTFYHAATSSKFRPLEDTKLVKIRRWLRPPNPSTNYQKALKLRQADTGLWLLNSEVYSKWKINMSSFVWLYGIPGCGKTILSSTVTQDILNSHGNDPGIAVAYFYFDFTDKDKQKSEFMVRSLISQLSEQCINVPLALEAIYSSSDMGNREPSLDALMNVLQQMLQEIPQSYLILDALDECADRANLMNILELMAGWQIEKMHLLFTSRKERDIESSLEDIVNGEYVVCLQSHIVDKDIQIYVRQRLSDDKRLKKWQKDTEIRREIETTLLDGACGMFRWAVCQLDTLGKCRTRLALQKALTTLPATLDETYERILCTISDEDSEYAMRILQWLAFSSRPLLVEELAEVVAISVEPETAFNRAEILEDPMDVLDICMSLVSVVVTELSPLNPRQDTTSRTVTLAHYSVQEYLISTRICQGRAAQYSMQPAACHGYIAKGTISYLLQYEKGFFDGFESARSVYKVYALAQYSAEHWMTHTRKAGEQDRALECLAMKLLSTGDGAYMNWLRLHEPGNANLDFRLREELDKFSSPLYYASLGGLANIVTRLIEEGADVNARTCYGYAPQVASSQGHEKIVEMLLSAGADVDAANEYGFTALYEASANGHEKIVEILLSAGADVNARTCYGYALQVASSQGHEKIVEMLLSAGADVNAANEYGFTALYEASANGHEKIVEMLLSVGADVNAATKSRLTALFEASARGHEKIVEMLLSVGADVNAATKSRLTALYEASANGHEKIVEMLLSAGADVNAATKSRLTALFEASARGHEKIVEMLLSVGADVNAATKSRLTALYEASANGHEKIVEMLLSAGADVNARTCYGYALQVASSQGHEKIVEMLLSVGADVNAATKSRLTALYKASANGHEKIVEILLSAGADVNARTCYGYALQVASSQGHEKIVEMLLSEGAV